MRSKDHLFDVRCVERNIRKGLIKRDDYKKHLKALREASAANAGSSQGGDESSG